MKKYPLYVNLSAASDGVAHLALKRSGVDTTVPIGHLRPLADNPIATAGPKGAAAHITADGKYLYVSSFGTKINGYAIDEVTGALNELSGSPWGVTGSSLRLTSGPGPDDNMCLFVGTTNGIYRFPIGANGALGSAKQTNTSMKISGLIYARGVVAAINFAETPSRLYTFDAGDSALTPIQHLDLIDQGGGNSSRLGTLAFSSAHDLLLCALPKSGGKGSKLIAAELGYSGEMDHTVSVDAQYPYQVVTFGDHVYVSNDAPLGNERSIQGWKMALGQYGPSIDALDGFPVVTPARPFGMVIAENGESLYTTIDQHRYIDRYVRDPVSGALTRDEEARIYEPGIDMWGLALDRCHLYATDFSSAHVLAYRVELSNPIILPHTVTMILDSDGRGQTEVWGPAIYEVSVDAGDLHFVREIHTDAGITRLSDAAE